MADAETRQIEYDGEKRMISLDKFRLNMIKPRILADEYMVDTTKLKDKTVVSRLHHWIHAKWGQSFSYPKEMNFELHKTTEVKYAYKRADYNFRTNGAKSIREDLCAEFESIQFKIGVVTHGYEGTVNKFTICLTNPLDDIIVRALDLGLVSLSEILA